ncbi:hypothetical protein [Paracoccus laeviglucosivorans]|uniref:Uncharacterized protein n=1 Tax=Paracoccus laeviglucosivorans TaxID=1197861 RepID=A0A521FDZ8_9RHOB|nr:hypothetical protein [Paracoccus laeviglucosivorans]SMO93881.1 hypothetical protein SAMN06265221_12045 [Paracoccus laeviglucosivorans]
MKAVTSLDRVYQFAPDRADQALADLNRRLERRGRTAISPQEGTWFYDYSIGIGGDCAENGNIWAALAVEADGLTGYAPLSDLRQPLPPDRIPPEIRSARVPPVVARETTDHIAAVPYRQLDGNIATLLVHAGYSFKKTRYVLGFVEGEPKPETAVTIYRKASGAVIYAGRMQGEGQKRFTATPEGGTFTYQNKRMTRMTAAEIAGMFNAA